MGLFWVCFANVHDSCVSLLGNVRCWMVVSLLFLRVFHPVAQYSFNAYHFRPEEIIIYGIKHCHFQCGKDRPSEI